MAVSARRTTCDLAHARARLAKARQFSTVAAAVEGDAELRSAEASNLIESGIASADAICCVRLGERSSDANHAGALALLRRADPSAAKRLQVLLGMKTAVQYGADDPSGSRLAAARRAAAALLEVAEEAVAGLSQR